jgi:hypothetical protein
MDGIVMEKTNESSEMILLSDVWREGQYELIYDSYISLLASVPLQRTD